MFVHISRRRERERERERKTERERHEFCCTLQAAPQPWPFNPDDFIATLETSGPQLTSGIKGDWVGLYRKFFRSPNFSGWYNSRYKGMSQKLQILQLEALSDAVI